MSRYIKQTEDNKILAYGFDHFLGYWYDVQDPATNKVEVEKGTYLGNSKSEIHEDLTKLKVNEQHLAAIALDLEF
jgi:hypothetical protein